APPPPPPPPAPHPPPPAPRPPPRPPPPRHCIAQSPSRSREGSNRLSHSSPESGSSTTAWNTASWISSPAYNICRGLPSSRKLGREATAALGGPLHYIPTGNHRVDEHELVDTDVTAGERRAERPQRLCDERRRAARACRGDDQIAVLRQPGRGVCAGKLDRDNLVATLRQLTPRRDANTTHCRRRRARAHIGSCALVLLANDRFELTPLRTLESGDDR